jgi:hypothetical protein
VPTDSSQAANPSRRNKACLIGDRLYAASPENYATGKDVSVVNAQDATCPYTLASIQRSWAVVGTYGANVAKAFGHRSVDANGTMTGDFVLNALTTGSTTGERTVSTGQQAGTYIINCDGTGIINRTTTSLLGIVVTTVDNFAITGAVVNNGQLIATELTDAQQIPSGLVPGGIFLTRVHTRLPDAPAAPSSSSATSAKSVKKGE